MTTKQTDRPATTLRAYPLQAAIWRNETKNGPFHTVTFSRSYKDDSGEYHDVDSYSGPQLLQLSHLANKAYEKAEKLTRAARAEADDEEEDVPVRRAQQTASAPDIDEEIPF